MTNLDALQSMVEYDNSNLLSKALTDRGLTSSSTYTSGAQQAIELAAADIYMTLMAHPSLKEGSRMETYTPGALLALAKKIYRKWGETTDTITSPVLETTQLW